MKLVITQEILDLNPGLALELGQEINLPDNEVSLGNESDNPQTLSDGEGDPGGNNPPKKPNLP